MTVMITGRALLATILVPVDLTKLTHISNTGLLQSISTVVGSYNPQNSQY